MTIRELKNLFCCLFVFLPDKVFLEFMYRLRVGKKLNLTNPVMFNEKIQWLKLYDRKPYYSSLVDKYEVKQIVKEKIGDEYVIPTYGVWEKFDDIEFEKLPNSFVIKCTHDSGSTVICKDKSSFDAKTARKLIKHSLKTNYYYVGREWPYKTVKPRVIVEKYVEDDNDGELRDYKFFCFDGIPKLLLIVTNRQRKTVTSFDFYDMDGTHLNIQNGHPNADVVPHLPETFVLMKELAGKLSAGMPNVRVDLYEANGKVYFSEMTLYHWGGFKKFEPETWEKTMGDWIVLPQRK